MTELLKPTHLISQQGEPPQTDMVYRKPILKYYEELKQITFSDADDKEKPTPSVATDVVDFSNNSGTYVQVIAQQAVPGGRTKTVRVNVQGSFDNNGRLQSFGGGTPDQYGQNNIVPGSVTPANIDGGNRQGKNRGHQPDRTGTPNTGYGLDEANTLKKSNKRK